ncbi:MAG TPA: hypothetical protein PKY77_19660 [Phycisphaerae bacterium]|nr:hypothetical protein [Phycisphaerae bacterium]HRY70706.1 hypothetical protein [Phycisphaerae bacterium]HSA28699.1 hypothetical protein [Phycisphaerae bacterium]
MDKTKPVEKFRAGQVSCAIWANEITVQGQTQKVLKASVSRRYKDRDGAWQTSTSFLRNEIPLAIFVLFQAFESMLAQSDEQDRVEPVDEERVI